MKQKLLTKLLFLLLCTLGGASFNPAWGDEVTFTPGTDTGATSVTKDNVTATMTTMNNSSYYQIYANQSGTFSCSNGNITKIEFTCTASGTSKYGPGNSSANVGSYSYSGSKGTWTGNAASVTISSTAQVRMTSLTITYTPAVTSYDITKSATNGTISTKVSSTEVTEAEEDATVTIEATPNTGYSFSSWSVTKTEGGDAVSVTSSTTNPTTFTMPGEAVTVSASFTKNSHDLDLTTTYGTCAVTVNGDDWDGSSAIEYGAAVSITATPSTGYLFDEWDCSYDGATAISNVLTFTMPDEDVLVEAKYVDASSVKSITISDAIEHGTVTASANTASEGDIIELTATPDDGYAFSAWDVRNDDTSAAIDVESDMFEMPDANVTVSATFSEVVAESVSLDITSTTIYLGVTTATLTATVSPSNALNKTVTWESSDEDVATVSEGVVTPVALGTATITVKTANNKTATCAVTVATAPKGSQYNPFTCAEAIAAYDDAGGNVNSKYVKGIVTKISGSNYYISDDGVVGNEQFECYNGKQEDGTTSINSTYLNVGDVVVASGNITKYSSTYELASGNVVYSKTRPVVTVTRNNNDYGTVSLTARTITATPTDGYCVVAGNDGYTVTSGEATVVNNGDNTLSLSGIWADCTVQVNFVALPKHTVTFAVNGNTDRTATVAEGSTIPFPTAVATPSDATEIPKEINGKTFVGWFTAEYTHATDAPDYVNSSITTMGVSDVTYYAVYADVEEEESDNVEDAVKSQTLEYDTWSYSGSTTNKSSYRLFHSGSYIESDSFDLSKLIKVVVKGGTFGGGSYNSLTIGDGTNTWKDVTVSGSSETGTNTYTGGTALSGTNKLRITCNSGTASSTGVRISKVEIYVKGTNTTYSNFTTDARAVADIAFANSELNVKLSSGYTGQALTNPNSLTVTYSSSDETVATVNASTGVISALLKTGSTTITATFAGNATYKPAEVSYDLRVTEKTPHGLAYATAEVAKLTTDDAFTNTLTNGYSLTVSYSSSETDVATVNASTGEVTIKGAGSATITATFVGNEDYEAGSASYCLTVSKATPTLAFASTNATLRQGKDFEGNTLTTTPGGLTVSYSSSAPSVATVDSSTGVPSFVAAGSTTITATFAGNDTYTEANVSYTLKTLAAPTIAISNADVNWGNTFTFDASGLASYGDVSLSSGNEDIATVDGLVITPVACGEVVITVNTAENETFDAGSDTFTLTINAPEGNTSAPETDVTYTFDFSTNTNWNFPSSSKLAETSYTYDGKTITINAPDGHKFNIAALLMGKSGATLTLPAFDKPVTKITVCGYSGGSSSTKQNIYVGDVAVSTETTSAKVNHDYVINPDYQAAGTIYTLKVTNAYNTQTSGIIVHMYQAATATVKLNASGFATYCSEYPLDFSDYANQDFRAWQVIDVDGSTITFEKITKAIKGGQGIVLSGTANASITIPMENSSAVLSSNLLHGTTAPVYFAQDEIYGLSGNVFKPNNTGVIPANKAYLSASEISADVKSFTFVFLDDEDGIIETKQVSREEAEQIFDLSGRRLQKMQRGINIVNGKKVVIK